MAASCGSAVSVCSQDNQQGQPHQRHGAHDQEGRGQVVAGAVDQPCRGKRAQAPHHAETDVVAERDGGAADVRWRGFGHQ